MSEFHEPHIRGKAILTDYVPTEDNDVATMGAVRTAISNVSGSTARPIFITDVTPVAEGVVVDKQYVAGTVPQDSVVTECLANNTEVRIHFMAEAGINYSPTVDIDGMPPTQILQDSDDTRLYVGYFDVSLVTDTEITISSNEGTSATVLVRLATQGPDVLTITNVTFPGQQSAVKANDLITIEGTVDNEATALTGANAIASHMVVTFDVDDSAGVGAKSFVASASASSLSGQQAIMLVATNSIGTEGPEFTGPTINMDQTYPVITITGVTYPVGQTALKSNESATVNYTVEHGDDLSTAFENGSITLGTSTYSDVVATDLVYNEGQNFEITSTRYNNGAVTRKTTNVRVAAIAPDLNVMFQGGGTYQSPMAPTQYNVTVSSDQDLSTGSLTGASLTDAAQTLNLLTGKINIDIFTANGQHQITASATNQAGIETVEVFEYTVRGFVKRTLTFDPASQSAPIGSNVVNAANVRVNYAGTADLLTYVDNKNDIVDAFTVVNSDGTLNPNGDHLWLNDVAFTGSNTSGTLQVEIEEIL